MKLKRKKKNNLRVLTSSIHFIFIFQMRMQRQGRHALAHSVPASRLLRVTSGLEQIPAKVCCGPCSRSQSLERSKGHVFLRDAFRFPFEMLAQHSELLLWKPPGHGGLVVCRLVALEAQGYRAWQGPELLLRVLSRRSAQ